MMMGMAIPCRFGDGPAVALYEFDQGCVCFPDEHKMALCAHHEYKATPIGTMKLIRTL